MSTHDVPGANPANRDQLAMGAWAEHKDGSLIFVEGTEGGKAIYSVFDMAKTPPIEYRDAMLEKDFKVTYSWSPLVTAKPGTNEKWTWHDKTAFPWDRIVKNFNDGFKSPSAQETLNAAQRIVESRERHRDGTGGAAGSGSQPVKVVVEPVADAPTAAERVAAALRIEGKELDVAATMDRMDRTMSKMATGFGGMTRALNALPGQIAAALKPKKRAGGR